MDNNTATITLTEDTIWNSLMVTVSSTITITMTMLVAMIRT